MEQCTFHPSNLTRKSEASKFDGNEFYQKNLEWKQKVEAEDNQKQDERFKLLTVNLKLDFKK